MVQPDQANQHYCSAMIKTILALSAKLLCEIDLFHDACACDSLRILNVCRQLFQHLESNSQTTEVTVSAIQIAQEKAYNLLDPESKAPMSVKETKKGAQ